MTNILAAALLLAASAPLAATAASAATTAPVPAAAVVVPARHHRSTVHDVHGQRFDVPRSLLRNRSTLINGLSPQPTQFD